jgi:Bacterial protein of unknown function (DUF922)
MGGQRVPGVLGSDPSASDAADGSGMSPTAGNFFPPGPIGTEDDNPIPLDITRTVKDVVKDWEPPNPHKTEISVGGKTIKEVADALNLQEEWGQGGGILTPDVVPPGNTTEVTVKLHLNLFMRLPRWTGYAKASPAAKAEWDQMIVKLRAHEERHVAIAVEVADEVASALVGQEINTIPTMVNGAGQTMHDRQKAMDDENDHGMKEHVPFGDVGLDITVV